MLQLVCPHVLHTTHSSLALEYSQLGPDLSSMGNGLSPLSVEPGKYVACRRCLTVLT